MIGTTGGASSSSESNNSGEVGRDGGGSIVASRCRKDSDINMHESTYSLWRRAGTLASLSLFR